MSVAEARLTGADAGRIGPNAILQYLPAIEASLGRATLESFLRNVWRGVLPDGSVMIDEADAARFHQRIRCQYPERADSLAASAGAATADHIIAHRIPASAKAILSILPAPVGETMLSRAIAAHARSFAGSGEFRVESGPPLTLAIVQNPLVGGERSAQPVCSWHAAVFRRLYGRLLGGEYEAAETACCACGDPACRFELRRRPA